jgi:hypothetical protein
MTLAFFALIRMAEDQQDEFGQVSCWPNANLAVNTW